MAHTPGGPAEDPGDVVPRGASTSGAGVAIDPALLQPLDVDGVGAVAIGTLVWGVALVASLLLRGSLEAAGNGWWVGVCLAGFLLGLAGLPYVIRRRAIYRRAAARDQSGSDSSSAS